ncbi:MAG: ABC transporter ATP-binding protein [Pseudomonadota bacterium]
MTIRDVTKTYGNVHALDHVSLDIQSGEFMTLLGPSGSGKTTLLMVLAGFTRPDHGSVRFGDREVIRTPPHQRDVGMVFQNYALFPHMDVLSNVAFPLKLRKVGKVERLQRAEEALETVQLGGYGDRQIDQLSGGQRQRVALARAIVFAPRILLMDEPLSALDKKLREHMQIELRHLHEKLGMTTVYVTHDQREALTMSDRIAVINHGRLMQLDEPRRLYERPANRFVADFIGESTFLPVDIDGTKVCFAGKELMLAEDPGSLRKSELLIRPEQITIHDGDPGPDVNVLDATVAEIVFQGDSFLMYAKLADGTAVALRGSSHRDVTARIPEIGEAVALGLHRNDAVLIPAEAG